MDRELVLLKGLMVAGVLLAFTVAPTLAQQDREIALGDFTIEPATFTVSAGQPVRLSVTNVGAAPHNLVFELEGGDPGQPLFPTNLRAGQSDSAEFTFSQPGTWTMYCPVGSHRARGMVASVQVEEAAASPAEDSASAAGDPPPSAPEPPSTSPPPPPPPTSPPAPPPAPNPPPRRPGY
jgi:plastocyanin